MYRERIRANPWWMKGEISAPRYDCVLVENNPNLPGLEGLLVGQLRLLYSIEHEGIEYPCALVDWFQRDGDTRDEVTGMWKLRPRMVRGVRHRSVIHLDCVLRGAHLLPVFGEGFVPRKLNYTATLNVFRAFYLNHNIDHHAFEVLR